MKKTNLKFFLGIFAILLLTAVMAVTALAANPSSGYCVNDKGQSTNIKYTMTAEGVLTFEIDPNATDNVQTTVLYNKDPVDGSVGYWGGCPTSFAGATKVIIGDGITELHCLMFQKILKQVEIPASLTVLGESALQTCHTLESVYIRGTEPVKGLFDLSNITSMSTYVFDDCKAMTSVKINPNYVGPLPVEGFKCTNIKELEVPAGVTNIPDKCFMQTYSFKVLTILGMETTISSDDVFAQSETYPAIKAKAGSKAEAFAKANGYTFIDLDTGEKTEGTKAAASESSSSSGVVEFNPEGATHWGYSYGEYNLSPIINTYWAYYEDTKTLEFFSNTTGYNETGSLADVAEGYTGWENYKDKIEHIVVGDGIIKISGSAFLNCPAIKDVRLGKNVNQIDPGAFINCKNLTTVWKNGDERVEGRADFSELLILNDIITGTSIKEIILPIKSNEPTVNLPYSVKSVYISQASNVSEALVQWAKDNLINLYCLSDASVKHEYYVEVDETLPSCGKRSVFGFDEATGTLTVYGAGAIDGITNYYGGGSKNQPWFNIRKNVKHIVISDNITEIGKYAFCEFVNLETVQIPNSESFTILSAAFEKCHNLKSVYRAGNEPIEGTLDIRNVHELSAWTFAYDYLIANIVISPNVEKIGSSVFEENITINLKNVYGTPGSFAETYAADNGLAFFDISANEPQPVKCEMPESTGVETDTKEPENTEDPETTAPESESEPETTASDKPLFVDGDLEEQENEGEQTNILPIIIIIAAVVVILIAVVVIIIAMKKKKAAK
ncbi:MAG: leucine-rich repeat protein [Clostridia bacterium]|nr:leucine-rich repeat protein [Clostridia bacterium]